MTKRNRIKAVERHLFNYRTYEVAIDNLTRQLNWIMPNITASYEAMEGTTGTFMISSSTERTAIDRIESRRAMEIHEEKNRYELILNCIDAALATLTKDERSFIETRYFQGVPVPEIAHKKNAGVASMYRLKDQTLEKLAISLSALESL